PDGFRNEVQVISTVMSVDQNCSSEIAAMIGASIALCISDIPFLEPIAGVHVGRVNGEFIINPTTEQEEQSDLDLTVAGTKDAIMFGHEEVKRLVEFQEEIIKAHAVEKIEPVLIEEDEQLAEKIEAEAKENLLAAIQVKEKHAREDAMEKVKEEIVSEYEDEEEETIKQIKAILDRLTKEEVRRLITAEKIRPDGRGPDEIRPLTSRVGILPRTHGSGLFTRGQTQALSVCTLGALGDVQI